MAADAFLVKTDFRFLNLDLHFRFAISGTKCFQKETVFW